MDNDLNRRVLLGSAGLVGVAALAALAKAGPISPPSGAVAPTGRTLTEIEPRTPVGPTTTPGDSTAVYRITQPGSYYLTGPVTGVSGKHGIDIAASNVTLDLCGYTVTGPATISTERGIRADISYSAVAVFNGHVSGWEVGVSLSSPGAIISGITASNCTTGISVANSATLIDCIAAYNNATGIAAGALSTVARCHAYGPGSASSTGIQLGQGSVATDCAAGACQIGFTAYSGAVLRGCTAYDNNSNGIFAQDGSLIVQCQALGNLGVGFHVDTGCSVLDSTSRSNGSHAILAGTRNTIRGNTCSGLGATGGHGIQATGTHNRIEDNHCIGNNRGIDVTGTSNLIVRNSVAANSTFGYAFATGNMAGPNIVPAGNPISTSSNPHSNYEL